MTEHTPEEVNWTEQRLADAQFDRDALNAASKAWMARAEAAAAERDRLKADKAELVGALEHLLHRYLFDNTEDDAAVKQARAVLAKAKREAP